MNWLGYAMPGLIALVYGGWGLYLLIRRSC